MNMNYKYQPEAQALKFRIGHTRRAASVSWLVFCSFNGDSSLKGKDRSVFTAREPFRASETVTRSRNTGQLTLAARLFEKRAPQVRSGVLLLEILGGVVLLLAAVGIIVQVIAGQASAERAMQRKTLANEILANLLEEQSALPAAELTEASVAKLQLPQEAANLLPGAELKTELTPQAGLPAGKKLSLLLSWLDPAGERCKPLVLSAWFYPPAEDATP